MYITFIYKSSPTLEFAATSVHAVLGTKVWEHVGHMYLMQSTYFYIQCYAILILTERIDLFEISVITVWM